MLKILAATATLAFISLTTGCVNVPLGTPSANATTTLAIRNSGISPINVGTFKPASTLKPQDDKTVSSRGSTAESPIEKSFSSYLRESLKANLAAAGTLSTSSPTVISGELTQSELSTGSSKGNGKLSAKFMVKRNDQVVYNQEQVINSEWESSFIGAVAIPRAFNEYGDMYRKLIEKLFSDSDFVNACRAQ